MYFVSNKVRIVDRNLLILVKCFLILMSEYLLWVIWILYVSGDLIIWDYYILL